MLFPVFRNCYLTVVAIGALLAANRLLGDALIVTRAMRASTIAEIFVDEGQVRVDLEIGAADVEAFKNVLPDQLFENLTGETIPLSERLRKFLDDDWVVRSDNQQLEGRVERIVPAKRLIRDEITGDPLFNQPDDAEHVIRVEMRFTMDDRPTSLAIRPLLAPDTGASAANIGFVVYHLGVAVNDFRYFAQEETLHLDWSDPWYSAFERKTLRRQFFAPAAAFLYVENFEVRKEIIFRPKDLQSWLDLGLVSKPVIPAAEREAICTKAAAFLAEHSPVRIDGKRRAHTLDRVHFIRRTLRSSGVVEPNEDVDINTALIGAIYVYPIDSLPQKVTMRWDLFNDRITRIPTVATDEAGGMPSYLEPDDPLLVWENFLTSPTRPAFLVVRPPPQPRRVPVPVVSLICLALVCAIWIRRQLGKPSTRTPLLRPLVISAVLMLSAVLLAPWTTLKVAAPGTDTRAIRDEAAEDVTRSLLHNVYRAFDYRDESTIYDVLERSISGELLTTIYLETRRSLTLTEQGGARVKVKEIEFEDCQSQPAKDDAGFVATCTWNVTGSVGHWGHLHQRRNRYRAEFMVRPADGQWKIHDMQLLAEERLY